MLSLALHLLRVQAVSNTADKLILITLKSRFLCTYTALILQFRLMAGEWWRHHHEQGERDVDESDNEEDRISQLLDIRYVQFGDAQCRCDLLPAEAGMDHEEAAAKYVESRPDSVLEKLILQSIYVAHTNWLDSGIICPEQIE